MKTKIIIITILIISILSAFTIYSYQSNKLKAIQKQNLILQRKVEKKSDIEILEERAKWNFNNSQKTLQEINHYKEMVKILEPLYEIAILRKRCYEAQIERKINWLEYNLNYCKDENNLEQFRKKK